MPILNYTTKIEVTKTVGEIGQMLAKHGARSVVVDYNENQQVEAVSFSVQLKAQWVSFRLPCKVEGVYKVLCNQRGVPHSSRTRTQARRVAWRIIKDWLEAQLALVEAGQAELAEVFLPYALMSDGQTAYQAFAGSGLLRLEP